MVNGGGDAGEGGASPGGRHEPPVLEPCGTRCFRKSSPTLYRYLVRPLPHERSHNLLHFTHGNLMHGATALSSKPPTM